MSFQDQPEIEANVSLASWDVEKTAVFAFNISHISNKVRILELLPALTTLTNHNRYLIESGNENGFFKINQKEGISYLHFTKKKPVAGTYSLQISSTPLYKKKELKFFHFIWHIFVLGGSILQFFCVYFYVY